MSFIRPDKCTEKIKSRSGDNDGTYIWGRGTLDDKGEMIMILEAVEKLLGENYQPERSIYLAFGHDEETGGQLFIIEVFDISAISS